jgi:hypothetical protein
MNVCQPLVTDELGTSAELCKPYCILNDMGIIFTYIKWINPVAKDDKVYPLAKAALVEASWQVNG